MFVLWSVADITVFYLGPDTDRDGIRDVEDDCLVVPNGPLLATGQCSTQEDGDHDGYENPCDTDINNDGATGLDDVLATLNAAMLVSTDPIYDFNCDGAVGYGDVIQSLRGAQGGTGDVPGPSGLACAGTIPCP